MPRSTQDSTSATGSPTRRSRRWRPTSGIPAACPRHASGTTATVRGADVYGLLEPGGVVWRPLDLGTELSRIARDSASFHDPVDEGACHMLLMGLCFGVPGYLDPISNRETGYGRNDFRLAPDPLVTVEVKFLRPDERA